MPEANALPASFLLLTFYANGASFLAFAILAEKRELKTAQRGEKSLYFTTGLLEGSETILFLVALCLWPASFGVLAWGFGTLCLITAGARVLLARRVFGPGRSRRLASRSVRPEPAFLPGALAAPGSRH